MTEAQVEKTEVEDTKKAKPTTDVVVEGRDYRVAGNDISGYVGVDPEYMTYANKTEQPLNTAQEQWDLGLLNDLEGNMDNDKEDEETVEDHSRDVDDTKEGEETEAGTETETPADQPSHNPPATVPGVFTSTVK